jgi:N-acetylglucosamine kinase-like BadF-type ATPase
VFFGILAYISIRLNMKYLIGIDGGGTKTDCAIADLSGKIICQTVGKPSNFLIIEVERAIENLFTLIEDCLFEIQGDFSDVKQIVIGVAGAGREEDAKLLEKGFKDYSEEQRIHFKGVKVVSDAHVALEGAFPNSSGCILIAGTGSILFGKDEQGKVHRVGGFGRLIGDEGSGYSIGRKALNAVTKEIDGRGESTTITELLNNKIDSGVSDKLINKVYKEKLDVASVAKITIEAAENGDEIANKILSDEADELVLYIKAFLAKVPSRKLNISFSGSLIDSKNFYSELLKKKIKESLPMVKVVKPVSSPVQGAILLAKRIVDES